MTLTSFATNSIQLWAQCNMEIFNFRPPYKILLNFIKNLKTIEKLLHKYFLLNLLAQSRKYGCHEMWQKAFVKYRVKMKITLLLLGLATDSIISVLLFIKKSLIRLQGQSMTPRRDVLFPSFQQLDLSQTLGGLFQLTQHPLRTLNITLYVAH